MTAAPPGSIGRSLAMCAQFGWDMVDLEEVIRDHDMTRHHWGGIGCLDERYATFLPAERWIGRLLADEGHHVLALPQCRAQGTKSPDAAVSGLLTEFKTFAGTSPRKFLGVVARARAQASRIVVHAVAMPRCLEVDGAFRAIAHSARRRQLLAVKLIGPGYQLEWGEWNPWSAPWIESASGGLQVDGDEFNPRAASLASQRPSVRPSMR